MDYICVGQILLDDIVYSNKRVRPDVLGGIAYTIAGIRYWSESVGVCSGIGDDFENRYDGWFLENGIDIGGNIRKAERCSHTRIYYRHSEERVEEPVPGCASLAWMMPQPEEIPVSCRTCRGLYLFKDCEAAYWKRLLAIYDPSTTIIWELHGDAARAQNRERIAALLPSIELFSLNAAEGSRIFGTDDRLAMVDRLLEMGARNVLLRMGADGAIAANASGAWHAGAYRTKVVDVTGGGNSSTGGFLAGYCESGGDVRRALQCANASASFIIEQYGLPRRIDAGAMKRAREHADAIETTRLL